MVYDVCASEEMWLYSSSVGLFVVALLSGGIQAGQGIIYTYS